MRKRQRKKLIKKGYIAALKAILQNDVKEIWNSGKVYLLGDEWLRKCERINSNENNNSNVDRIKLS